MYARVLVPTDGSACSDAAVDHALAVAKAMGATVLFLYVMDVLRTWREGVVNVQEARQALTAQGRAILERALARAIEARVRAEWEILEGSPAEAIAGRAPDFDLVVMGSHGKGLLERITVGSVTEAVLRRVTQPLLVVRCTQPQNEARR